MSQAKPESGVDDARQGAVPKPSLRRRFEAWYRRNRLRLTIGILVFLFLVAYLADDIFISILPGQRGVVWSRFFGGTLTSYTMREGLRVKLPWDKVYIYDTRLEEATDNLNVLSSDGLTLQIEVTVRYRLVPDQVAKLHKTVGPEYQRILLMPEVASHTRREMSQFEPEDLFSKLREQIEDDILEAVRDGIRVQFMQDGIPKHVFHIEDLFIRSIVLPKEIDDAIKSKLAQRQLMLEYDFRIQREEKEAQRKAAEAKGIKDFQDTVMDGITPEYLRWKGIDATLALAQSNNSKIVVIGAGEEGLPIILGNVDSPSSPLLPSAAGGAGGGAGSIAGAPGSGPSSPPVEGAGSGSIAGAPGSGPSSPPVEGAGSGSIAGAPGSGPSSPPAEGAGSSSTADAPGSGPPPPDSSSAGS